MNTARTEQPIDPPGDGAADRDWAIALDIITDLQREATRMEAAMAEMEAERGRQNWRQLLDRTAKAARDAEIWLPLTMAAIELLGGLKDKAPYDRKRQQRDYERVREWCSEHRIVCRKRGPNWDVEMTSARAYAASRGILTQCFC
jgi:hypothetical protein